MTKLGWWLVLILTIKYDRCILIKPIDKTKLQITEVNNKNQK